MGCGWLWHHNRQEREPLGGKEGSALRSYVTLGYKFAITAVLLSLALPLIVPGVALATAVIVAVAVTIGTYLLGDLALLPRIGGFSTALLEVLIAAVTVHAAQFFLPGLALAFSESLVAGVAVGAGEWFYHRYILTGPVRAD